MFSSLTEQTENGNTQEMTGQKSETGFRLCFYMQNTEERVLPLFPVSVTVL